MLQHFGAIFDRRRLSQPTENSAEVRRIAKAAANGDVFQFEIVIAKEKFAAGDTDVSEIVDEGHMAVAVKDTRQVVRAHSEDVRDGITRDVILIICLQIDADAFEKALCPVRGLRGRFMDHMLHALDQGAGELGKCGGRFSRGMEFQHRLDYMRNRTAEGCRDRKFISNEPGRGPASRGDDADAELFSSEEQRHDFDFAPPGWIIPAVGRDK